MYCHTSSGQQHSDRPQYEKTAIQCKSLVQREGMDNDLRTGHEKTVPLKGVDDDPRRGHEKTVPFEGVDEERTREDCHSKGWTMTRGEDTKRLPFEGVDDDPSRGHEKTAIRRGGR